MKTKLPSLRKSLQCTALALALSTLSVVGLCLLSYDQAIDAYASHSFATLAYSMETQVSLAVETLETTAKAAAYAPQVQTVLFTQVPSDYLRARSDADQVINLLRDGNVYADFIYLLCTSDRQGYVLSGAKSVCRPWLKAYLEEGALEREPFFSPVFFNSATGEARPYFLYVMPVSDIRPGKVGSRPEALCAVACDLRGMLQTLQGNSAQGSTVCLLSEGSLIASGRELTESERALVLSSDTGLRGQSFLYRVTSPRLPWTLVFLTPRAALSGSAPRLRNIAVMLLLGEMAVLLTLFLLLFCSVARPLRRLVSDVQAIRHTQYTRVRPAKMEEFVTLSDAINRMLAEIEDANQNESEARERLYAAQEEQTRAKLYAYRTQINPHFLFNALECIRSLAQRHGVPEIEEQVRGLSRSYRYLLSADMVVTLAEELRSVEGYFNVLRPQYAEPLTLKVRASKEAKEAKVLSMTLQPLVENALLHGLSGLNRPGVILIAAEIGPDRRLSLRVADNGHGISEDRLKEIYRLCKDDRALEQGEHIGLGNITRRLRLFFGPAFSFDLASSPGHYTCIHLRIPCDI